MGCLFLFLPHLFSSTEIVWGSYSIKQHFKESLVLVVFQIKICLVCEIVFLVLNLSVRIIVVIFLNCSKKLLQHCPKKQNPFYTTVCLERVGRYLYCQRRGKQKMKARSRWQRKKRNRKERKGGKGPERRL